MELEALKYIAVGLMAFGMLGAAIGIGHIFSAAIGGVARNPSAENKLAKYAFIGAGLSEAMGLFAFLIAMLLLYAI